MSNVGDVVITVGTSGTGGASDCARAFAPNAGSDAVRKRRSENRWLLGTSWDGLGVWRGVGAGEVFGGT